MDDTRLCPACGQTRPDRFGGGPVCVTCERAVREINDTTPTWMWDCVVMRDALERHNLGGFLALVRSALDMSQLELAELIGWSQSSVARVESGDRDTLFDLRELLRLADRLDIPREALSPLLTGGPRHTDPPQPPGRVPRRPGSTGSPGKTAPPDTSKRDLQGSGPATSHPADQAPQRSAPTTPAGATDPSHRPAQNPGEPGPAVPPEKAHPTRPPDRGPRGFGPFSPPGKTEPPHSARAGRPSPVRREVQMPTIVGPLGGVAETRPRDVHVAPLPVGAGVVVPARITATHVTYLRACVDRLYAQDQVIGGALLIGPALSLLARARRMLDEADYSEGVGRRLLSAVGEIGVCAGRLALDSALPDLARKLHTDACLCATQATDDRLFVHAASANAARFSTLCAEQPAGGREALRLLDAAYDAARHWATPRVYAMLSLRESQAHAVLGQEDDHRSTLARAIREFERGPHEDDPPWAGSMTRGEISAAQGVAALALHRPTTAIECLRTAADAPDTGVRDRLQARALLSTALLATGDEHAAFREGLRVLPPLGASVLSPRVRDILLPLRRAVWSANHPLAADFATAFDRITT
ncbi:helix-turn-helix domain-containing protein [Sinosporangium siamense]|uniref:HTH cro/C1-type domain-containing protein n=1 Tax=Sinosporangium siamense TaxID=1367973 RepID=A0A919RPQ2_9ACTN|nr:helix-turn-helix transcriptional regulator [Sinosporangium siamense]GII97002.1 hypothetical protein Ssi02_72330 [Sinosporangium siamense]